MKGEFEKMPSFAIINFMKLKSIAKLYGYNVDVKEVLVNEQLLQSQIGIISFESIDDNQRIAKRPEPL